MNVNWGSDENLQGWKKNLKQCSTLFNLSVGLVGPAEKLHPCWHKKHRTQNRRWLTRKKRKLKLPHNPACRANRTHGVIFNQTKVKPQFVWTDMWVREVMCVLDAFNSCYRRLKINLELVCFSFSQETQDSLVFKAVIAPPSSISSSFSLCFPLFIIWLRDCPSMRHEHDFFHGWALYTKLTIVIIM